MTAIEKVPERRKAYSLREVGGLINTGQTKLFKHHRLPFSAPKDVDKAKPGRRPSKFVIFIRELQQLIEPQYRQHTHSDEALAAAITRARSLREGG